MGMDLFFMFCLWYVEIVALWERSWPRWLWNGMESDTYRRRKIKPL